ncbi:hypothetical protein CYLTODRAFT_147293 [Cylindrobasidium torrendii FP15055 ss-10]|uniref:Uncharacterized protein n=1 Tax=Cylindrobasidium torrendii FP15055 ss-10 TaxID=1314674 RepID=A0A0D7B0T8_9AGAR|nr:hypothetical protein CYLTODRAFT_147293 [Cylindrobasidium torrendii FP15055 ss-10]
MALARRIVYPKYEYDPNGIYENENVQQWAQYYAAGGLDPAGAVYFFSVPGITGEPEPTEDAAPEITTGPDQHSIMALGAESAGSSSSGHTRQSSPRGPRQRVRKGVLGLLEFLQITKRGKNKAPPYLGITSTTWTEPAVWIPEADTDIGPVPWDMPQGM